MKNTRDSTDVSGRDENDESQDDAQIADESVNDDTTIKLEPMTPGPDDSPGINPYDSGTFDTSKSWDSHAKFKRTF